MQKTEFLTDFSVITPTAQIGTPQHGWRAKCLQRLVRLELPVPATVALPAATVRGIAAGQMVDCRAILQQFGELPLISVRPSPENPDWGGPATILNIGFNAARHARLVQTHGQAAADALYLRFVQGYAVHVARLDPDMFDGVQPGAEGLRDALRSYQLEMDEPFPEDPARQLADVLRSMARAWEGTTARLLRQAKGAPAEAALGLVVQQMAQGIGQGISGSGVMQFVDPVTGDPLVKGRYLGQSQGRDALTKGEALYLTRDKRGPSLEDLAPEVFAELLRHGAVCRARPVCATPCAAISWRWTSPSPKTRRVNWPMFCAPWRGPGRARRRGFCAKPRARRPRRLWGWWCSRWRRASGRGFLGLASFSLSIR